MTENIPALVAEARRFDTEPAEYAVRLNGAHDLIARLADALESLSSPSGDDREARSEQAERVRAAVAERIRGWYTVAVSPEALVGEMAPIWEAEFRAIEARRLSPLTREALEEVVGLLASYGEYVEVDVAIEYVRSLSRFSLPEPAEDEWCREESCQYRHWRSGSMPTHKRGAGCPSRVPVKGTE